jgi:hypothetical protein
VSLAFGDGLGAGYTLETFNETEESIRVVLNNRKKYLTALEILQKHNIKVATSSLLHPQEDPTPLKILMKTPSSSQRSFRGSESTNSYQNPTPLSVQQQEGEEEDGRSARVVSRETEEEEDMEDVTENCIAATDFHEMKG